MTLQSIHTPSRKSYNLPGRKKSWKAAIFAITPLGASSSLYTFYIEFIEIWFVLNALLLCPVAGEKFNCQVRICSLTFLKWPYHNRDEHLRDSINKGLGFYSLKPSVSPTRTLKSNLKSAPNVIESRITFLRKPTITILDISRKKLGFISSCELQSSCINMSCKNTIPHNTLIHGLY